MAEASSMMVMQYSERSSRLRLCKSSQSLTRDVSSSLKATKKVGGDVSLGYYVIFTLSYSVDLPFYFDLLATRIGKPKILVIP